MPAPKRTPSPRETRAAITKKPRLPKLAKGEVYAGITLHDDRLNHLILLPGSTKANWEDAGAWASKKGGALPSRHDGLVLFKHAKAQFKTEWYWLDAQLAVGPAFAWYQHFGWGFQYDNHTDDQLFARAVRRVPIQ